MAELDSIIERTTPTSSPAQPPPPKLESQSSDSAPLSSEPPGDNVKYKASLVGGREGRREGGREGGREGDVGIS